MWTRSEICALDGEERLDSLEICNRDTGERAPISTHALFIMIGAAPNTDWLGDKIALDEKGFILTGSDAGAGIHGFATSLPGVYAVGDIRSGSVKRVASAVGEGSVVVSAVHGYLDQLRRGEGPSGQAG